MKKYNDFYINSTLFIFLFILLSVINLKADDRYYLHSKVFQNINNDKSLEDVVNIWVNFLFEEDDSIRKSYWDSNDISLYQDDYCLFCNSLFQFPRETFLNVFKIKPYIISIEQNENTYFIKTIFTQANIKLSDSSIKNQNPAGIIKVAVIRDGNKLYLKNIIYGVAKNWTQYKINNINYFVEPSLAIDTSNCMKAIQFCDSISHLWYGKEFSDTINYFVAPTSESIESLIGLEFAYLGSFRGMTLINARIILDGTKNFNYRHELVHIILSDIQNKLLSEGLATYFGGSAESDYLSLLTDFSKSNYPLTDDKLTEIYEYPNFMNYYIFGALLCEEVYNNKGVDGLKSLVDCEVGDEIAVERICKLLNLSKSELMNKINERIKF